MLAPLVILSAFMASTFAQQMIFPVNSTSIPFPDSTLKLALDSPMGSIIIDILPLTPQAGLGVSASSSQTRKGTLVYSTPDRVSQVGRTSVAYLDCEAGNYGGYLTPASTFSGVVSNNPQAVVLFSTVSDHCNLTLNGRTNSDYTSIYTVLRANSSQTVQSMVMKVLPIAATIYNNRVSANGTDNGSNDLLGPRPTTQIAMIVLYSITGLITALFLGIIASGAIRAHRHPERYGPRAGMLGRPRQSRAKGIARAMLETLPIVKFGEQEEAKKTPDVELAAKDQQESSKTAATTGTKPEESSEHSKSTASEGSKSETEGGDKAPAAAAAAVEGANDDEGLSCSICTEDFVKGEDIRVLPCDHKYHPACVDPWLLNVSGTCPLCRIDLRPAAPEGESSATDGDYLAPPLSGTEDASPSTTTSQARPHHSRISRYIELRRMPAEERLEALRELRREQRREQRRHSQAILGINPSSSTSAAPPQEGSSLAPAVENENRRSSRRLSTILGNAFRIHTRRMPDGATAEGLTQGSTVAAAEGQQRS